MAQYALQRRPLYVASIQPFTQPHIDSGKIKLYAYIRYGLKWIVSNIS